MLFGVLPLGWVIFCLMSLKCTGMWCLLNILLTFSDNSLLNECCSICSFLSVVELLLLDIFVDLLKDKTPSHTVVYVVQCSKECTSLYPGNQNNCFTHAWCNTGHIIWLTYPSQSIDWWVYFTVFYLLEMVILLWSFQCIRICCCWVEHFSPLTLCIHMSSLQWWF